MENNEYYLSLFKKRLINRLLSSDDLITLINPKRVDGLEVEDVLVGGDYQITDPDTGLSHVESVQGHIFDFFFVDETITDKSNFVCIEVLPDSYSYPLIQFSLYIYVFVPKEIVRLDSMSVPTYQEMQERKFVGNRVDQMLQAIAPHVTNDDDYGLKRLEPYNRGYITVFVPKNNRFYGKCMRYVGEIAIKEKDACDGNI